MAPSSLRISYIQSIQQEMLRSLSEESLAVSGRNPLKNQWKDPSNLGVGEEEKKILVSSIDRRKIMAEDLWRLAGRDPPDPDDGCKVRVTW